MFDEIKVNEVTDEMAKVKEVENMEGLNLAEEEKALDVVNTEDAKAKVSDVKVVGNPDVMQLLCKASSESQGWMKSTKVCNVYGGCIVQVSTHQKNPDGTYVVAEAVTFVPGNHLLNGKIDKM